MSKDTKEDIALLIVTFLASVAGVASAFVICRPLAWLAIGVADLYVFLVLLFAACRSDDANFHTSHTWVTCFFPRRVAGLFVVAFLFLSIISGFAGLYVGTEVFQTSKTTLDAFYSSWFILGFGDFSPKAGYGQLIVIAQVASGVLLLVGVFPLLISRVSTFQSPGSEG